VRDSQDPKHQAIRALLAWMLEPAVQRMAAHLHYAPLPLRVIALIRQRLKSS
jgi:hypothetical protein